MKSLVLGAACVLGGFMAGPIVAPSDGCGIERVGMFDPCTELDTSRVHDIRGQAWTHTFEGVVYRCVNQECHPATD